MRQARAGLVVAAIAVVSILFGLRSILARDRSVRNLEIFTEMAYSAGYESMSPNPHFPDGKTIQPVMPGVVVRGNEAFRYAPTPEDAERAGRDLLNPFAAGDAAALARGAVVYGRFCVVCHGGDGAGRGTVVERGMIPPPSLLAVRALEMKDGQMLHVLTLGQGNMASYAAQIEPEDRWKAILHVRKLQAPAPAEGGR